MKYVKWAGFVVAGLLVVALVVYGYFVYRANQRLSRTWQIHEVDIPVPWPLTEEQRAKLQENRPNADPQQVAMDRARKRGKHLVEARYACIDCHGEDFGGGTMIDDPMVGTIKGPNLTGGEGSVVADYDISDWDRIVRHGVKPDGSSSIMPSTDFDDMSDRELSDIVAYIRSLPDVDNEVTAVNLGPMGYVLVATGGMPISAEKIDHDVDHAKLPPDQNDTVQFGKHLAQTCTGCHGEQFRGGPVPGGPPKWPPASNLTPHESGLADWSFADFEKLMRKGVGPDGEEVKVPMKQVTKYGAEMTDREMRAMWEFFRQLPAKPTPK